MEWRGCQCHGCEEAELGLYLTNARWYDPSLGRFTQPDSVIPEKQNPQGFDRYAYVSNNPITRIDTSGHCWGIASGIRGLPSYDTTCNNLDMALTIVQSNQATTGQKIGAAAYIGTEGLAHAALVVGSVACLSNFAVCVAGAKTALGIGGAAAEAACADGDCTNEIQTTANTGKALLDVVSKSEAREALKTGFDGLSSGQIQKSLDILGKGRVDSVSLNLLENGNAQMTTHILGQDGGSFVRYLYTIDPSGKIIGLIQYAYNHVGELIHVHDKLSNIVIK